MNRHFTFQLKDEIVRGMNREQYKSASHMVRWWAWKISNMINWDKFHKHISDSLLYGRSIVRYEDLLL